MIWPKSIVLSEKIYSQMRQNVKDNEYISVDVIYVVDVNLFVTLKQLFLRD